MSIELIPDNLMTFRVPVKGMLSPCKFHIVLKEEDKNKKKLTDFKVFISAEEKIPREGNCEHTFEGKTLFFVPALNRKKTFDNLNLYVSFFSFVAASIEIRVKFPAPKMSVR